MTRVTSLRVCNAWRWTSQELFIIKQRAWNWYESQGNCLFESLPDFGQEAWVEKAVSFLALDLFWGFSPLTSLSFEPLRYFSQSRGLTSGQRIPCDRVFCKCTLDHCFVLLEVQIWETSRKNSGRTWTTSRLWYLVYALCVFLSPASTKTTKANQRRLSSGFGKILTIPKFPSMSSCSSTTMRSLVVWWVSTRSREPCSDGRGLTRMHVESCPSSRAVSTPSCKLGPGFFSELRFLLR